MALVNNLFLVTGTIQAGSALSTEMDVAPYVVVGILTDANWTEGAASIQATFNGGLTWVSVVNSSANISGVTPSSYLAMDPSYWRGLNAIKIQSGAAGSPVNQPNTTTVTLVCMAIL